MNKVNLAVIGYNSKYNKFLNYIRRKDANYKISYISKLININTIKNFKYILKSNKIKIMIICNHKSVYFVNKNIDFFINNNIKVVQASTNFDIENHGYIIKKPFKEFSFSQFFIRKTLSTNKKNLNKILDKKVVLITGGAGSIGSYVVKNLLKFKIKKLIILDNNEYNIFKLKLSLNKNKNDLKKIDFKLLNIENELQIFKLFQKYKPQIVFHAAALKHVEFLEKNTNQGIITNILGTENILKASIKNKASYFINVSTDKAIDPKNILGITKLIAEYLCHNYSKKKNTKIGVVRFGNVFNSYGSVSEIFKYQLFNEGKIKISHPNVERFFMNGTEAANLIISALEIISFNKKSNKCRTFICNMGEPIKIIDLAKKMIFLSGRSNKKYLSKKFYGLNNVEKKSEKLLSKNENIISVHNKRIYEISQKISKKNIHKIEFKNLVKNYSDEHNKSFLKKIFKN